MDEFLKELTALCKKHNIYVVGCGKEDEGAMSVYEDWSSWIILNSKTKEYEIDN